MFGFGVSSASAATLIHLFEFEGNLNDSLGGSALVANGGTVNPNNYTFAPTQGLSLSSWVGTASDAGNYTMDLSFKFTAAGGFAKIIDFKDRGSDLGLYRENPSMLLFYTGSGGPEGAFPLDTYLRVVLTRDGATNDVTGYVDGVQQFSFNDVDERAVFSAADNILRILRDDGDGGENGTGEINQFRIYSGAMTAPEVLALGGPKPIPEPSVALLGSVVLLGSCIRRSRK
jgi:hypothetical protein